jgi:hypothetical protein
MYYIIIRYVKTVKNLIIKMIMKPIKNKRLNINYTIMNSETTSRIHCFGIDMGSHKICVGQNSSQKTFPSPEILGDLMDFRKVPNILGLPEDPYTERIFGNSVASSKACNFTGMSEDPEVLYSFKIQGNNYLLPLFYVRNMIISHIKKIILFRIGSDYSSIKTIAYVPKFSHMNDLKYVMADMTGIKIGLMTDLQEDVNNGDTCAVQNNNAITNVNFIPINDINAITLAYIQKYVMIEGYRNNYTGQVLIIDIGYSKCQVIKFKVEKNKENIIFMEQLAYAVENIGCKHIDNKFAEFVLQKVKKDNPLFVCKSSSFNDQVIKLKHQLSTNQAISTWIQGTNIDVLIIITRNELNNVISSLNFKEIIVKMLDNGVGFDKVQKDNSDTLIQRHIEVVGGGARMPYVIDIIKEYCDEQGSMKIGRALNPDEAVAEGASLYGWLYNNYNSANLVYHRYVRNNIHIEYSNNENTYGISSNKCIFIEGEKILTTFTADTEVIDLYLTKMNCDVRKVTVDAKSEKFEIHFGNSQKNNFVIKMLDLPKEAEFVDVYVMYTLADTVWVMIKYEDDIINYEIETTLDNSNVINFNHFFNKYQNIETTLLGKDNDIVKKQTLTNYLEDYFNRKDDINDLICKIQDIDDISHNERILSVDDDITQRSTPLPTPIKEVYEFYQFCRWFMYSEDEHKNIDIDLPQNLNNLKNKKKCIDEILKDRIAVIKLSEASLVIENIKTKYNK